MNRWNPAMDVLNDAWMAGEGALTGFLFNGTRQHRTAVIAAVGFLGSEGVPSNVIDEKAPEVASMIHLGLPLAADWYLEDLELNDVEAALLAVDLGSWLADDPTILDSLVGDMNSVFYPITDEEDLCADRLSKLLERWTNRPAWTSWLAASWAIGVLQVRVPPRYITVLPTPDSVVAFVDKQRRLRPGPQIPFLEDVRNTVQEWSRIDTDELRLATPPL